MDEQHLKKLREDRIAREKARINKLRELNLKKYGKSEPATPKPSSSNTSLFKKPTKSDSLTNIKNNASNSNTMKNNNMNGITKRPISAPDPLILNKDVRRRTFCTTVKSDNKTVNKPIVQTKKVVNSKITDKTATCDNVESQEITIAHKKVDVTRDKLTSDEKARKERRKSKIFSTKGSHIIKRFTSTIDRRPLSLIKEVSQETGSPKASKTLNKEPQQVIVGNTEEVIPPKTQSFNNTKRVEVNKPNIDKTKPMNNFKKSMEPPNSTSKVNPKRQSVFERLYQPKIVPKKSVDDAHKLRTNPVYLKKVMKDSALISNKRHTVFEQKKKTVSPVRRSISAVHFKRISKSEIGNCIHKWSSIGDNLDKIHLKEINEDEPIKEDKFISAVKSERKKVSFLTTTPLNLNTPRPEELQERLQNWLKKRGKSIDSYHHLQCFGIHHLSQKLKPLSFEESKHELFDDENKENVPLESDSDNESYEDNMNNKSGNANNIINDNDDRNDFNDVDKDKWRRASYATVSDSVVDFNLTQTSMMSSTEETNQVEDLLLRALNDLTELLREGFDRDQCARWLRVMRERFPSAPESAAYWECRAALEESRGDLPTSILCWEEAIAKGTEHSVVEANLDQLLDKFMQLKISPNGGKKQVDPKLIDVRNIFKSTIIRFAVQQAKLRQTSQTPPKYICTPVRRSGRLSLLYSEKRTPLRVCTTVKQAGLLGHPLVFVPNDKLSGTP